MKDWKKALTLLAVFVAAYFVPFESGVIKTAILEAFFMLQDYVREHVLLCLIPAFFIAGAISNFISQGAVLKYLGPKANKVTAYLAASVSGSILSVCSCTVLPIFSGIHKRGAGLGPAVAFLYSGPAVNVLAIVLTARVLGAELGIARAVLSLLFSIVIGLIMAFLFRKEEEGRASKNEGFMIPPNEDSRPASKTALYITFMIAVLLFLNWGADESGKLFLWNLIFDYKYIIAAFFFAGLIAMLILWFKKEEVKDWLTASYEFALQIAPLLFFGVLIAGFLLGRPGHQGLIPEQWVADMVGGNSITANLFASVSGALMYFATLTEIPIIEGLLGMGMGKGPALSLLLAGPALSLPNMLVIKSVLGLKKTAVFVVLVVIISALAGFIFGNIFY